ncbi:hypothetical protein LINPERPRIM_LOCUS20574 [Linum perenne]
MNQKPRNKNNTYLHPSHLNHRNSTNCLIARRRPLLPPTPHLRHRGLSPPHAMDPPPSSRSLATVTLECGRRRQIFMNKRWRYQLAHQNPPKHSKDTRLQGGWPYQCGVVL